MLRNLEIDMKSVNRVVLLGNMGNSPEFRTFPSGDRVAHFSVCTTEKWKDRGSGELKERSEWNKVQVRDKSTVDYLDRYAQTGTKVYVEGTLRTRKVAATNGGDDRWFTEVDATLVNLLDRMRESESSSSQSEERQTPVPAEKPVSRPRAVRSQPYGEDRSPTRNVQQEPSGFETDDALKGSKPRF